MTSGVCPIHGMFYIRCGCQEPTMPKTVEVAVNCEHCGLRLVVKYKPKPEERLIGDVVPFVCPTCKKSNVYRGDPHDA